VGGHTSSNIHVHLHAHIFLLPLGQIYVTEHQTRRLQDPLSESDTDESTPNKDIQFGYHSASGKHIRITNNGLGAERMNPEDKFDDGVAYGAQPLKGLAEFEVKMVSYGASWAGSLRFGIRTCKKSVAIESGPGIPNDAEYHCVWTSQILYNNLITLREISDYGYVDLDDLREGGCVGLRLSRDGVLEFTVNGESQGIVAKNIYTRDTDVYAVVDHYGQCVATVITKAGEYYSSYILVHAHAPMIANSLCRNILVYKFHPCYIWINKFCGSL
jgi:hypothetical protein